ncbi:unnamed protein product [Brassica oleracea var. botrytis]|uniref:(rape) hypothetical protein n=1 Tax=Brassica napus TaxID=3708 RepID=A0A816QSH2_BRANA|nr:unnamed protein product [Brassica napus]
MCILCCVDRLKIQLYFTIPCDPVNCFSGISLAH